jgi:hypothetical protein
LLHVLKTCCRNALGVRSSTLADLPDELEPSLIMDLSWLNRARVRKIASANSRNFRESIGERLLNTRCRK